MIPIIAAHRKKIRFTSLENTSGYFLDVNMEMLFKIFRELLFNAVKYSPEEGKILILLNFILKENKPFLEVSFWNTPRQTQTPDEKGERISGIPYEKSEAVFEMFNTFENFPVNIEGEEWLNGTGLYIARRMLRKMNGEIDARNMIMQTIHTKIPYVSITVTLPLGR